MNPINNDYLTIIRRGDISVVGLNGASVRVEIGDYTWPEIRAALKRGLPIKIRQLQTRLQTGKGDSDTLKDSIDGLGQNLKDLEDEKETTMYGSVDIPVE